MRSSTETALIVPFLVLLSAASINQEQLKQYNAVGPKTILELQQFRQTSSIPIHGPAGKEGTATLVNLSPAIGSWYLLEIKWAGAVEASYHLENAKPRDATLVLDAKFPSGITIIEKGHRVSCGLWGAESGSALEQARTSALAFYPQCDGRIYLRNPVSGHSTNLEAATEFLREHVWGSEKLIALGHVLMGDAHRESANLETGSQTKEAVPQQNDLPSAASIASKFSDHVLTSANLEIALDGAPKAGLTPGTWYRTQGNPGVYVSIIAPKLIDPALLTNYQSSVNALDNVEASALCYLVAFDLDRFEIGYELGTEHPKVGWSDHILDQQKDPKLPGPDGIGTFAPLIATGLVSPEYTRQTVATFVGGFKRTHGAFKYGDLASRSHGSHYGFIEDGVVFSKLQPGLATVYVLDDSSLAMKTWTEADDALLVRIRHARQNGVPIIEFEQASQTGIPGAMVNRWGAGNWSGSELMKLRTMRSGLAIQRNGKKRFLIYAVFSDATPSAMARVFQAYHCDYAMLLDMNALEHTYLAVYRRAGTQFFVDHLLKGMDVLEKPAAGETVPRFLGYSDNRDFFYVMRR